MNDRGQWFVVQTLSGQELRVQETIQKRLEQEELEELIFEALVPMEQVTEVKMGRKTTVNRKFYPGYILVKADLYDDDRRINERVWTFIQETTGIIGFVGGDKPPPLGDEEVREIMAQLDSSEASAKPRIEFDIGEMLKIRDGAFQNFEGKVESIDPDRGRLTLSVSIFGRSTPVEVEYWQVERV